MQQEIGVGGERERVGDYFFGWIGGERGYKRRKANIAGNS